MSKTFLPTVARALLVDPDTDVVIGQGYLLSETGLNISMSNTDVRGDRNNARQFLYYHTRDVEITLTNVQFEQTFLATNLGETVVNASRNVWKREGVKLSSGSKTLLEEPVGNVSVARENGSIVSITPTGSTITVPDGGDENVVVYYRRSKDTDRVSINATKAPSVVTLILLQEVLDNHGTTTHELSVEIPSYQTSGTYELAMTADGVSTTQLTGMALSVTNEDATEDDVYGYVDWIPTSSTDLAFSYIVATPSPTSIAVNGTQQLTVYGARSGIHENVNITADATYSMKAGSDSDITVSSAGLITVASGATVGDTGTVVVQYTSDGTTFNDEVNVTVS